jgi:hypothetical protein
MALSLSIILCSIIAAASANIRLERCHFCDHPIVRPTLLTLDDREEAELSKEPWFDPVEQVLTEIAVPGCSGRAAVMVDRSSLSCLLYLPRVALASHYGRNRYSKRFRIDDRSGQAIG